MLPIIIKFVNCAILIANQANVCLETMSLLVFNVPATSFYLMELALILPVPNIIMKELEIKLAIRVIEAGNNNNNNNNNNLLLFINSIHCVEETKYDCIYCEPNYYLQRIAGEKKGECKKCLDH